MKTPLDVAFGTIFTLVAEQVRVPSDCIPDTRRAADPGVETENLQPSVLEIAR